MDSFLLVPRSSPARIMSITPSEQQERIVKAIQGGYNVQVIARAGVGKTSTAMFIAQAHPDKTVLVLTYNRALANDTKATAKQWGSRNVQVRTIHECIGKCNKAGGRCISNVHVFTKKWEEDITSVERLAFQIIVLDEMQDLRVSLRKALTFMLPVECFRVNKSTRAKEPTVVIRTPRPESMRCSITFHVPARYFHSPCRKNIAIPCSRDLRASHSPCCISKPRQVRERHGDSWQLECDWYR